MTTVAAVLVTHNSARWIERTLTSVASQSRPLDAIVIIDDNSTDDTRRIIQDVLGGTATVFRATSKAEDIATRIAHNFLQGVRAARDYEIAVLGDHDDVWHRDRVERQVSVFEADAMALMVASDGVLVDAQDVPTGGTLRSTFPVPRRWSDLAPALQMHDVVRHSIATGGASALRPTAFADGRIPAGWLHDRWWSLVATARGGMRIDEQAVIDYRVTATQQVGLDSGSQRQSAVQRVRARATHLPSSLQRVRDLHGLATVAVSPEVARELRYSALAAAGIGA